MPCRVAYLAEQNCRKSAEARLDTELRKTYKLQAHNQEIAHSNARLQQQLRAAKNEVHLLVELSLWQACCRQNRPSSSHSASMIQLQLSHALRRSSIVCAG